MTKFTPDALAIDAEAVATRLAAGLRDTVKGFRRRGLVVAVSGGIDSACVLAIAVRALGKERVHALLLPERDSDPQSTILGRKLCERFGVAHTLHDIAPVLEAAGCYRERDEAVRSVFPEFEPSMRWKMVIGGERVGAGTMNFFSVVLELPGGETKTERLPPDAYLRILAATNYKQRTRKMFEYFHADRLHFAVAGTPNRLEYDQGFFVKLGDGAADVKPIALLYKTQVYAVAKHLGVIDEIVRRPPTTDTYSLPQSQEEFYFAVDHHTLDLLLWARDHGVSAADAAPVVGLDAERTQRVYDDIDQKRRAAEYLHAPPVVLSPDADDAPAR